MWSEGYKTRLGQLNLSLPSLPHSTYKEQLNPVSTSYIPLYTQSPIVMPSLRFLRQLLKDSESSRLDSEQRTLSPSVNPFKQTLELEVSKTAETLLALYPKEGQDVSCQLSVKISTDNQWADQNKQKALDVWTAYTRDYSGQTGGVVKYLEEKLPGGKRMALDYLETLANTIYQKQREEEKATQATSAADPGLSEQSKRQQ